MFIPANEKQVHLRILLALAGPTGSGKTYSAMEIASGICGDNPFAVIDTESDRALHYRGDFNFDHASLEPPFRPARYTEAIEEGVKHGYKAIVVDSGSHEHAGEGGLLDWHEEILQQRCGDDFKKRDRMAMAAWVEPKMAHKRMVQQLLRSQAPAVIFCMRAEEKTGMTKEGGKTQVVNLGWKMICEKNLPYEFTAALMMSAEYPGTYQLVKCTKHLQGVFSGTKITKAVGKQLVEWSAGDATDVVRTDSGSGKHNQSPVDHALALICKAETVEGLERSATEIAGLQLKGEDHTRAMSSYKAAKAALKE